MITTIPHLLAANPQLEVRYFPGAQRAGDGYVELTFADDTFVRVDSIALELLAANTAVLERAQARLAKLMSDAEWREAPGATH